MRAVLSLMLAALALAGCVQTRVTLPPIDTAAVTAETLRLQRAAIDTATQRAATIQRLAWPLLAANVDLCPKRQRRLGLQFVDAASLKGLTPGLTQAHARQLGYGDKAHIAIVTAGGPGERAGLRPGERIRTINGDPAPTTTALIRKRLGSITTQTIALTIEAVDGSVRQASLKPQRVCAFPARLAALETINASTNGKALRINAGLLRAFADDEPLIQIVIGHELAHAILRHPQRAARASALSGGAVLGAVAGSAGWVADQLAGLSGNTPPVSYQRRGLALATWPYSRDLEREADYVGLYLAARAGVDLANAERLFEAFAIERPTNTWIALSHPITPERVVALRATRAQIEARKAAGLPLVPDGLPLPKEKPDATRHIQSHQR
jgi:Zn-dependent protease with chaperone function